MNGNEQYYGNQGNYGGMPGAAAQYPQGNTYGNPQGNPYGGPQGNPPVNVNYAPPQQSGGNKGRSLILTILAGAECVILAGLIVLTVILLMKLKNSDTVSVETVPTETVQTDDAAQSADDAAQSADDNAQPADDAAQETEEGAAWEQCDFSALVIDAYTEDLDTSSDTQHYAIPMIDWTGGDVQAVNDEIYNFYYPYIERMRAMDPSERAYGESGEISYTWYMNDGILTIIVENYLYPDASGWREPDIWNVDFRDPENPARMDGDAVLAYFGIGHDDFIQEAEVAMGNTYCSGLESAFNNGMDPYDSFTQQQFSRTIDESNAEVAVPFVGENGHLWIKGQIYSIAAGDKYPQLIDLEDYQTSSYYTEFMGG